VATQGPTVKLATWTVNCLIDLVIASSGAEGQDRGYLNAQCVATASAVVVRTSSAEGMDLY
jgi:hypothetical protein